MQFKVRLNVTVEVPVEAGTPTGAVYAAREQAAEYGNVVFIPNKGQVIATFSDGSQANAGVVAVRAEDYIR